MRRIIFILIPFILQGALLHFNLYKKEGAKPSHTLLVIGGIHGNEPGGYYGASFLVKFYKIKKGALWVVPNLNFDSLIRFRRGIYGDMNRKFAYISPKDKDYRIVKDIQQIILHPKVDIILNLHDGHGFYRESWKNSIFNPSAWGQTCIIDQKKIDIQKFGNLEEIAKSIAKKLNKNLKKEHHCFNVKNTNTKFKDEQMRLSLTYFAITNDKPAFAIETSKNIRDLATKIFYQLRAIEEFMRYLDIEYERDFELNIKTIKKLLKKREYIVVENIILPLQNLKSSLYYIPFVTKNPSFFSKEPLAAVVKSKNKFKVYKAEKRVTTLHPVYFKRCKKSSVLMRVDSKTLNVKIPSVVKVKNSFKILTNARVNVIGVKKSSNESNITIYKDEFLKRYSLDRDGKVFRAEIYEDKKFCGWVLIEFD